MIFFCSSLFCLVRVNQQVNCWGEFRSVCTTLASDQPGEEVRRHLGHSGRQCPFCWSSCRAVSWRPRTVRRRGGNETIRVVRTVRRWSPAPPWPRRFARPRPGRQPAAAGPAAEPAAGAVRPPVDPLLCPPAGEVRFRRVLFGEQCPDRRRLLVLDGDLVDLIDGTSTGVIGHHGQYSELRVGRKPQPDPLVLYQCAQTRQRQRLGDFRALV